MVTSEGVVEEPSASATPGYANNETSHGRSVLEMLKTKRAKSRETSFQDSEARDSSVRREAHEGSASEATSSGQRHPTSRSNSNSSKAATDSTAASSRWRSEPPRASSSRALPHTSPVYFSRRHSLRQTPPASTAAVDPRHLPLPLIAPTPRGAPPLVERHDRNVMEIQEEEEEEEEEEGPAPPPVGGASSPHPFPRRAVVGHPLTPSHAAAPLTLGTSPVESLSAVPTPHPFNAGDPPLRMALPEVPSPSHRPHRHGSRQPLATGEAAKVKKGAVDGRLDDEHQRDVPRESGSDVAPTPAAASNARPSNADRGEERHAVEQRAPNPPPQIQSSDALSSTAHQEARHPDTEAEATTISLRPTPPNASRSSSRPRNTFQHRLHRLCRALQMERYTCSMNCFHRIKRKDKIWSCSNCSHIFHLACVQRWSRSDSKSPRKLKCPQCRAEHPYPTHYTCYCGKVQNPPIVNPDEQPQCSPSPAARLEGPPPPPSPVCRSAGETTPAPPPMAPHCCSNVCGKARGRCTKHPCPLRCHPGPCPACVESIPHHLTCACGKTSTSSSATLPLPCGTPPPLCTLPCRKPRSCGHPVALRTAPHRCHFGPCPKCIFCRAQRDIQKKTKRFLVQKENVKKLGNRWRELYAYNIPPSNLSCLLDYLICKVLKEKRKFETWKDIVRYLRKNDLRQKMLAFNPLKQRRQDYHFNFIEILLMDYVCSYSAVISEPTGVLGMWLMAVYNLIRAKQALELLFQEEAQECEVEESEDHHQSENGFRTPAQMTQTSPPTPNVESP